MLQIKLTQVSKSKNGRGFDVFLGNGNAYHFPSQRNAIAFLNETSRFLTMGLFQLQDLYIQTWTNCQESYFLSKIDKEYKDNDIKRRCENAFATVESARDLAIMRCTWPNGAYFVFLHIRKIADSIKIVLRELRKLYKTRSDTAMVYRITSRYKMVLRIEKDIECFKEEESAFLFDFRADMLSDENTGNMFMPKMRVA